MTDRALIVVEKEFVAMGIAAAKQCEPCIKLHAKKCLDAGATREEILEAAGVAVMIGGDPAYTQIPMIIESLNEFES